MVETVTKLKSRDLHSCRYLCRGETPPSDQTNFRENSKAPVPEFHEAHPTKTQGKKQILYKPSCLTANYRSVLNQFPIDNKK